MIIAALFGSIVCIEGDIRLADSESITTKSGMEFTSGYPVVCVDDQLVPVCDNFDFGLFELTTVCQIAENITCKYYNYLQINAPRDFFYFRWIPRSFRECLSPSII